MTSCKTLDFCLKFLKQKETMELKWEQLNIQLILMLKATLKRE